MHYGRQALAAVGFLALGVAPAMAATTTVETYSFEAKLKSGALYCGVAVSQAQSCPDQFGKVSGSKANTFMNGKAVGGVYKGQISIEFDGDKVMKATCEIGGADCNFGAEAPRPSSGSGQNLNFSKDRSVSSSFKLDGNVGSYLFATDYQRDDDGVHYYSAVRFDLTNVQRDDIAVVPLMGSAGFLLAAIGGFAAFSRRKSRSRVA